MTYTMALPDENTVGRAEARRALLESRAASSATDRVIAEAREWLGQATEQRNENHFVQKMRDIIRKAP